MATTSQDAAKPGAEARSVTTDTGEQDPPQDGVSAQETSSKPDSSPPTQPLASLVVLLASVLLAMFIVGLDRTIIATVRKTPIPLETTMH
jgi:hypothetical protein